jgi:hypothetical protein
MEGLVVFTDNIDSVFLPKGEMTTAREEGVDEGEVE